MKNLLIITQKVDQNDSTLGFFIDWIQEFSKIRSKIIVLALSFGEYNLPNNVEVLSLGKDNSGNKKTNLFKKLKYTFNFYRIIISRYREYDQVFVHMNPEYVCLGGLIWKILKKEIFLWYVHRAVNFKLKFAEFFADKIFSASESSFNLKSKKVNFIGHGIRVDFFNKKDNYKFAEPIKILTVSRITKIKRLEILIETMRILRDKFDFRCVLKIIGEPKTKQDFEYKNFLCQKLKTDNLFEKTTFSGALSPNDLASEYFLADLSVNLSPTGGLDKVVMESMASGLICFMANFGFEKNLGALAKKLIFKDGADLAEKIYKISKKTEKERKSLGMELVEIARRDFNLSNLILKLDKQME